VLAFHASVPGLNGGFVGVDIFFVISGFLITGQLMREIERHSTIRLGAFYARRARRLVPPAAVVLAATAIGSYVLLPRLATFRASSDMFTSIFYISNWHFIAAGNNYLAASTDESPVLHFWSLAVEEQFYLVWPLLILVAVGAGARWIRDRRRAVIVAIACVTAASFVLSWWLTTANPGLAYMATYTRAWQFGVGALVSLLMSRPPRASHRDRETPRWLLGCLGAVGFILIAYAVLTIDATTDYPGLAALEPTLGAACLIAAGPIVWSGRVLANRAFRAIGRISYSWYLWHWPVLILAEHSFTGMDWHAKALVTLASALPATLTYLLVERMTQRSTTLQMRVPAAAAVGVTATVAAAMVVMSAGSLAARDLGTTSSTVDTATFAQVFGTQAAQNSGPVTPSPLTASKDLPASQETCMVQHTSKQGQCPFGVAKGPKIVLIGDSHIDQWRPAISTIADQQHWQGIELAQAACPLADFAPRHGDKSVLSSDDCINWRHQQIKRLIAMKPAIIVFSSLNTYTDNFAEKLSAWGDSIRELHKSGAKLVYLRDTPVPGFDVPECISSHLNNWSACAFKKPNRPDPVIAGIANGEFPYVKVVDMNGYLCQQTCPAVRNSTLIYRDDNHLTATASALLTPAVRTGLAEAGLL
jgi:peptidoglycan/LPS O-acetylase OafA/YrhL